MGGTYGQECELYRKLQDYADILNLENAQAIIDTIEDRADLLEVMGAEDLTEDAIVSLITDVLLYNIPLKNNINISELLKATKKMHWCYRAVKRKINEIL